MRRYCAMHELSCCSISTIRIILDNNRMCNVVSVRSYWVIDCCVCLIKILTLAITVCASVRAVRKIYKMCMILYYCNTVKLVLRDHCHDRPPVLKDHTFLVEGPTFQYNCTCHQRQPALSDHIFVAKGVVFQDRFYCIIEWVHYYVTALSICL